MREMPAAQIDVRLDRASRRQCWPERCDDPNATHLPLQHCTVISVFRLQAVRRGILRGSAFHPPTLKIRRHRAQCRCLRSELFASSLKPATALAEPSAAAVRHPRRGGSDCRPRTGRDRHRNEVGIRAVDRRPKLSRGAFEPASGAAGKDPDWVSGVDQWKVPRN